MKQRTHSSTLTGWREWVNLPEIGVPWIKAKIDTGAESSALHAYELEEFMRGDETWVRFSIHPWQRTDRDPHAVELPVFDRRTVRSSSGHAEERVVVRVPITLVGHTLIASVTLTNRDEMGFRMLIGREALRQGFVVDPAASYLGGRPPQEVREKNRVSDPGIQPEE